MVSSWKIAAAGLALAGPLTARADFDGPAPVAWRWAESTGAAPGGSPITDGETIYVAVGGRAYALDRASGNQRWRFPASEPLDGNFRAGGVLTEGKFVAATDNGRIVAVNVADGTLAWQYQAPGNVLGTPVSVGSSTVFRLGQGELLAVNTATGAPLWAKPFANKSALTGNLGAWQGNVLFCTQDSEVVSLDISTLKVNWAARFTRLSGTGGPVTFGDTIYINSGPFITAMRANSGGKKWDKRLDEGLVFSPAVSAAGVVVVSSSGRVYSFDTNGRSVFRAGIDLQTSPIAGPAFVGKMIVQPTGNGALNLIDPISGDIVFSYIMPPLSKGLKSSSAEVGGSGSSAAGGDDPGSGSTGGGRGKGASGSGAGGGSGESIEIPFVTAAGPAAVAGDTMLVLAVDGSLFAFDKTNGVDLTPPSVEMLWPNSGDQISGQAPLEMIFRILDAASGVNPETVKISIGGKEYAGIYRRDGFLSMKISALSTNLALTDGRQEIVVTASDWLGNAYAKKFSVMVDNTLRPLGSPKRSEAGGAGSGGTGPQTGGTGGG